MLQNIHFEVTRKRTPSLTWQPWRETVSPSTSVASLPPCSPHLQQQLVQLLISTQEFLASSLSSSSGSSSCLSFEQSPFRQNPFQNDVQSEPTDLSMSSGRSASSPIQKTRLPLQIPTPDIMLKHLHNNQSIIDKDYSAWSNYFTVAANKDEIQPSAASTPHRRSLNKDPTVTIISTTSTTLTASYQTPSRYQNRLCWGNEEEQDMDVKFKSMECDEVFNCHFCGKTYNQQSALKMHVRTHTLPCQCKHCGKSFSRKWLLKGHERTHTGERPYQCGICTRSFADRSNLRAHMQTHQIDKKYKCSGCPRSFSRMGLLHKHINQSPLCKATTVNE